MREVYCSSRFLDSRDPLVCGLMAELFLMPGVFETMRVVNGRVYLLERHLERLTRSCPVAGLDTPVQAVLEQAVRDLIHRQKISDGALRLAVFSRDGRTGVLISERDRTRRPSQKGISCVFYPQPSDVLPHPDRVKALRRDFYEKARGFARDRGAFEAVFANREGALAEGSRTNIFFVKEGRVLTPSLESGCLAGVMRARVLEFCGEARIPFLEARVSCAELLSADEIFLTNVLIGLEPVDFYEGRPLGPGGPGPTCASLMKLYQNDIEKVCGIL